MGCVLFVVLCPTQQLGLCRDGQFTLPLYFLGTNTRLEKNSKEISPTRLLNTQKYIFPSVVFLYSLSILGPARPVTVFLYTSIIAFK